MSRVIAILVSDVHFSHKPPVARAEEPDWYAAMRRPWDEIRKLQQTHDAPVIIAGDVFDRWNSPPELINFAMGVLPPFTYAIPGQHDLPNHRLDEMDRSAYGTLVKSTWLQNLTEPKEIRRDLVVHPFPWGVKLEPMQHRDSSKVNLAVVHAYVWTTVTGYPGATKESFVTNRRRQLKGYDAAVFGDNHQGFSTIGGDIPIFNCGTLVRRKTDEYEYKPRVGLLCADRTIKTHFLDISQDVLTVSERVVQSEKEDLDLSGFLSELGGLQADSLDFREAVLRTLEHESATQRVKEIVLKSLG